MLVDYPRYQVDYMKADTE